MLEKENDTVVAENQTKEILNDLRLAILNNFKEIWVFHHVNIVSNHRYLKVCTVWDSPLPKDKFIKIKNFSDKFLIDYNNGGQKIKKTKKKS